MWRSLAFISIAFLMTGCPRDVEAERPEDAIACNSLAECNPERTTLCGHLRQCAAGFCEIDKTLVVPCFDAATNTDANIVDAGISDADMSGDTAMLDATSDSGMSEAGDSGA